MAAKKHYLLISIVLLTIAPLLMADMGPKPAMDFEIIYKISPVPEITAVTLLECDESDCSDAAPLEELGPQGIRCTSNTSCDSMAYGYADYFRLVLEFSDGTSRTSNIFTKRNFNARYEVTVGPDDLFVDQTGGSASSYEIAFYAILGVCLCSVVLVIVAIVLLVRRARRKKNEKELQQASLD
jgi:hypothetical protein